ncbi:MAG: hypothetical protein ABFS21_03055 [Actinomycetota bacterium]
MDALLFRTRVTVFWLAVAVATLASFLLHLFIPGAAEELVAGEMEGETLTDALGFFFAAIAIFPLVMAGAALLVSDRVNPSVNLIGGLASGLFSVFAVVSHVLDGGFNVHVLMAAVAGVCALLIAGLSLARLRHPTSQPAAPASGPSRA